MASRSPLCEPLDISKDATQRGAIVYYENISHYRDFDFFWSLGEVTGDRIRGIADALARSPPPGGQCV